MRGALDKSIMERLRGRAGIVFKMLETQYRSHPTIMQFSNERFYHGKLLCGKAAELCLLPRGIFWDWEPNAERIIFRMWTV